MPSHNPARAEDRADQDTRRRGRWYTIAGGLLVGALVATVIVAMAGVVGPGLLTVSQAFFVAGAGGTVLAVAVAGLLFTMHDTLTLLREQQAAIDDLQDKRARAVAQEQRRTDRGQDADADHLRSDLERRPDPAAIEEAGAPLLTPFGDVHDVIDVEGIGENFAGQLRGLGLADTEQLWSADPDRVAAVLDVRRTTVRQWQSMAELMALDGVGPQYAELLVRGGVPSIPELAAADAGTVAAAVREAEANRDVRIQGNPVGEEHARKWVQAAREHDPQGRRIER